jgi:hypothetical protein
VVLVIIARPDGEGFSFRRLIHSLKTCDSTVLIIKRKLSHSKKLHPLIYNQYTVRPDEAFRFTVGSFIKNV